MLSITLPLLALAIALTPVVVSARNTYKREVAEQGGEPTPRRNQVAISPTEVRQSISAKTIV